MTTETTNGTLPSEAPRPILRAGYQGQPGSFGARAAARCGRPLPYATFGDLVEALRRGDVDAALLPAVESVTGPVLEPLAALAAALADPGAPGLRVTAELSVPIRLVFAVPHGLPAADVEEVLSQAPVLRQCHLLLDRLGARPVETADTAAAAAEVARLGGARAAVCSEEAALAHGLVPLEEDVSDARPNATRFWRVERTERTEATDGAPPPAGGGFPRVLHYRGERIPELLSGTGAELLRVAPGVGFAVVSPKALQAVARELKAAPEETATWLGPRPETATPPRRPALPKATAVREPSVVSVGRFAVGGGKRALIAGPCAVESEEQVMRLAHAVARAGATALRGGVFKPRTSPYAFQGHGLVALRWMKAAGDAVGLPIVTEVMAPAQVEKVAELADVLQIGARNCQNYDLLREAGRAGRAVLLKRGFGTTVEEWLSSAEYLMDAGCADVMLCERGIRTFENSTRGTLDLCGLLAARSLTHLPILADPSHAAGRRDLVVPLSRAAWGAGADGLIVEVHDTPESASCDGPQALLPEDLEALCDDLGLVPRTADSVERVRGAIDVTDREIGRLVTRRLELCRMVAEAKSAAGVPIRDAAREALVKERFARTPGLDEAAAARLADSLIALGLAAEGWREEGEEPAAGCRAS